MSSWDAMQRHSVRCVCKSAHDFHEVMKIVAGFTYTPYTSGHVMAIKKFDKRSVL
jgi:hypothetical protein